MTPTKAKKIKAIQNLSKANQAMKEAIKALEAIKNDPEQQHFIGPDAAHFRSQLTEMVYGDEPGDGSGMNDLIQILIDRYL